MYSEGKRQASPESSTRARGAGGHNPPTAHGRHVEDGIVGLRMAEHPCAIAATDQEPRPPS